MERGSGVFFDFNLATKVAPNEINRLRKKIAIFVHLWDSLDLKFQISNLVLQPDATPRVPARQDRVRGLKNKAASLAPSHIFPLRNDQTSAPILLQSRLFLNE
jgi:hypothetical protein